MNTIEFYGADWCPDCRRAKAYLNDNNIEYKFIDVDLDESATRKVEKINKGKRIIPTVIINGKSHTNPSNNALAAALGINDDYRVIVYGADWCPDCRKSKSFLDDNGINYQYIVIDENEWSIPIITKLNNGKRKIPTIVINDETVLVEPENEALRQALKIDEVKEDTVYDAIIIGGGAAGLTTSIYAQRDRFNTLILEKKTIGGNAFLTEKIENYPGFTSISGPELMDKMEEQAKTYGAVIKTGEDVKSIEKDEQCFVVKTSSKDYHGKSIVIATGSTYRQLGIPGEKELIGSGVHFCATCDGAFYRDKDIIVIGGGNSALEEGIFLAGFCKSVKIIHILPEFTASETYVEKLGSIKNISTYMNKKSIEFEANEEGLFKGLRIEDNETKEQEFLTADGVFIFIGLIPNTKTFEGFITLSERGFIETTGTAQTSQNGVFAAGDCREGAIAQVAAATGEGVLASYGIKAYLK
ncbi:FAD-dependent oxidoreductase [Saprospiraceae bacterium]|nr:FAD-dependent oxidoreductase [Saprospiraceae bacterium]